MHSVYDSTGERELGAVRFVSEAILPDHL